MRFPRTNPPALPSRQLVGCEAGCHWLRNKKQIDMTFVFLSSWVCVHLVGLFCSRTSAQLLNVFDSQQLREFCGHAGSGVKLWRPKTSNATSAGLALASQFSNTIADIVRGRQLIVLLFLIIVALCKFNQGGSVRGVCGRGGAIGASHRRSRRRHPSRSSKFKQLAMMPWKW